MIVREFFTGSDEEHVVKLIGELLQLFDVRVLFMGSSRVRRRGFSAAEVFLSGVRRFMIKTTARIKRNSIADRR